MKFLFIALSLFLSMSAFAQSELLDDLGSIFLQIDEKETPVRMVSYPGLGSDIPDCLILDIRSRKKISLKLQMQLAKNILVKDGFRRNEDDRVVLKPRIKDGTKVVFDLSSGGTYTTLLQVEGRAGATLSEAIKNSGLTADHDVNLVYVRGCRF
jgi:hypothetical protein